MKKAVKTYRCQHLVVIGGWPKKCNQPAPFAIGEDFERKHYCDYHREEVNAREEDAIDVEVYYENRARTERITERAATISKALGIDLQVMGGTVLVPDHGMVAYADLERLVERLKGA